MLEDSNKTWFSVEISAEPSASEAIEFALNLLDSIGIEVDSFGKEAADDLVIVGYFNELPDSEKIREKVSEALRIYNCSENSVRLIETKTVEEQDWLAEWKKHWKPTEIGNFIIAPSWTEVGESEKIVVKIKPNMAFGTGTHETTKLCLRAIEENCASGMTFLDVGTGTGILSIAVSKLLGRRSGEILGCDTDVDSVKVAKENAEFNQADGIDFYVGSITSETPQFDFVCANVTADIIIPMLPLLVEKFEKVLVLSGILVEQEREVLEELKKLGIHLTKETNVTKTETDGEWISIIIRPG